MFNEKKRAIVKNYIKPFCMPPYTWYIDREILFLVGCKISRYIRINLSVKLEKMKQEQDAQAFIRYASSLSGI